MTSRPDRGGATASPICRRLFTIEQAAAHAGVPTRRVHHWIRTRQLEAYHLEGGTRIDEVELDHLSSLGPKRPSRRAVGVRASEAPVAVAP